MPWLNQKSEITCHLQFICHLLNGSQYSQCQRKNNQALALGDNDMMIRSTSLRMTSAFSFPTCRTSSCDTVGVRGRSNAIPAS